MGYCTPNSKLACFCCAQNFQHFLWATRAHQLCWKDHLDFHGHAVCKDGCIHVGFLSKKNPKHKCYPHGLLLPNVHHCHEHIFFWLVNNNKGKNIQSSIWAALKKLGMWVVLHSSFTHMFCWCQCVCIISQKNVDNFVTEHKTWALVRGAVPYLTSIPKEVLILYKVSLLF